jgi:alkyl hydroperoxide reductase subunit AhpC
VLAVSVDGIKSHMEWQERELSRMVPGGIRFPMLSDPGGRIGALYGVYDEERKLDLRGHFIVDPDGDTQSMEIVSVHVGRNITEVLRQLRALRHQQETGELIPCGWEPGKPTLPGEADAPKLSGEVWKRWKPRNAF